MTVTSGPNLTFGNLYELPTLRPNPNEGQSGRIQGCVEAITPIYDPNSFKYTTDLVMQIISHNILEQ